MSRRSRIIEDWRPDPWDDPGVLEEVAVERSRRPRWWARVLGFTVLLVIVAFVLVVGAVGFWVTRQINPAGDPGPKVNFTVAADDTLETVATRLKAQGIITHERVFLEYVERKGGLELRPGYYTVRPLDNMGNIVAVLRTPPAQTFQNVTFPEGFTVEDMAARLAREIPTRMLASRFEEIGQTAQGVVTRFLPPGTTSLEGVLFPDTYQVAGNETEVQVIQRMADRMDRVATQLGIDTPPYPGITPYQVLVVASLVEKEAKVDEDRAKIAAVIWNRLLIDMPLEIDATLLYRQDPNAPFAQRRATDTPWNTYLYRGLPPTPIANPGAASIRAALRPAPDPNQNECAAGAPCKYLFYVLSDAEGRHAFATTFEEHEANVAKARAAGLLG